MKSIIKHSILILFIIMFMLGCQREKSESVSLHDDVIQPPPPEDPKLIKIAVSAIISPKETFIYYKEILDYVAEQMAAPVKLVQRNSYAEVNQLIKNEEIHAAFVCSGAYVDGHDEFGMELLVAPKAYGEPYYYSYIIVPADSDIKTFEELRGKEFAFSDPLSNTGKLVPTYMLSVMGETPDSFFSKYTFTYSHDKSIEAVALKIVDGAAVDSLIYDYYSAIKPKFTSKTKIISKSPPYGIPPVVVPKELDPKVKKRLKEIFLNMHKDPKSRIILDKLHIDSFIEIDDSAYSTVREMRTWLDEKGQDQK